MGQSPFTAAAEDRERLLLSELAILTSLGLPMAPRKLCQFIVWEVIVYDAVSAPLRSHTQALFSQISSLLCFLAEFEVKCVR